MGGSDEWSGSLSKQVVDIVTAIEVPKREIQPFEGDVTQFHPFMAAFDFRIGSKPMVDVDKLMFLAQYLRGDPLKLVEGCYHMTNGYQEARRLLQEEYGSPYSLAASYIEELRAWPAVKTDEHKQLKNFSMFLTRCLGAMAGVQYMYYLNHPDTISMAVEKLPPHLKRKWPTRAQSILESKGLLTLEDLGSFVKRESDAVNHPMYGLASKNASTAGAKEATSSRKSGVKSL
jgi:hypothetical protein